MIENLMKLRADSLKVIESGPPLPTSNPFFGVGPITDGATDEMENRLLRYEFEAWIEKNYRKLDDQGRDVGPFTVSEIGRSMHRGYPADKILTDMMREIHRYFEFPKANRLAVGLGGGHSAFTVCAMHMMNANDPKQHIFVDTPTPESDTANSSGFFRQSWGSQLVEMQRHAKNGEEHRLHFAHEEGHIAPAQTLRSMGVRLVIGVGHETTGATTYSRADITNLLEWLDSDPDKHHAVLDATSMLGAMPWPDDLVKAVMKKCCLFMPLQKAIGGISGYFVASFTPAALALIEANQTNASWAIPRQLKLLAPVDPKRPLSGDRTINLGPFYDPSTKKMLGGVVNTFSALAFAETSFGLLRSERKVGPVSELNRRSIANRASVEDWVAKNPIFKLSVEDPERRGTAVTLLKVNDQNISDPLILSRIVAKSKQLLSYEGVTHPNGEHDSGLDVARYINAFPGTPGEYRAWIGGIRSLKDIVRLLDNLKYAYHHARIIILEEELAKLGHYFEKSTHSSILERRDKPSRAYTVLIVDYVGLKLDAFGHPDHSVVKAYIESKDALFHLGQINDVPNLEKGKIHFFYMPDLSSETQILEHTHTGLYDAVIAAATSIPRDAKFKMGGVRIGSGTGNMGSASWGGGSGKGGEAPLMNTPGFNSRATAQMVMKAILKVIPDLPVDELHRRVLAGDFDTGRNLREFPTEKLEGKKIAVIGYGNIGRQVAKLAAAFGMQVAVFAKPHHRDWIVSEGFDFADTIKLAATQADVISIHVGLGSQCTTTGRYSNTDLIDGQALNCLNDNAVLINYDRGEIIAVGALEDALAKSKIRFASIDADIFKSETTENLSGPLIPYLDLALKYPGQVELLPHAVADTDHWSRIDGAKQAVDQIFDCIQYNAVTNLKGELPSGFFYKGQKDVRGVSKVTSTFILEVASNIEIARQAREITEQICGFWGAISTVENSKLRLKLIENHGSNLILNNNLYAAFIKKLGLEGEYDQ